MAVAQTAAPAFGRHQDSAGFSQVGHFLSGFSVKDHSARRYEKTGIGSGRAGAAAALSVLTAAGLEVLIEVEA
jgi:hypothetical protein